MPTPEFLELVNFDLLPDLYKLAKSQQKLELGVLMLVRNLANHHEIRMQMLENKFFDFALGFLFHQSVYVRAMMLQIMLTLVCY